MMLADGNLLISVSWAPHVHFQRASRFFAVHRKVATCPITELNLLRVLMQAGHTPHEAEKVLDQFVRKFRSRLIPCDLSAMEIAGQADGHRQTTDAYLAMLAKKHGLTVATLDEPFSRKFPGLVELVP